MGKMIKRAGSVWLGLGSVLLATVVAASGGAPSDLPVMDGLPTRYSASLR